MPSTKPSPDFPTPAALLQRYRSQILTLIFAVLAVWLAFTWLLTVQRIVRYYSPFPTWDYWRVIYDAYFHKTLGYGIYLKPHNEHRIIFPEIIYQLDLLLLHGRIVLPLVCSFLCYLATYLVLSWVLSRDYSVGLAERAFACALAGLILGWQGSAVALGDPFLFPWTLSTFCVVVSLFSLTRRALSLALMAAVIATYSSANSLLLWPVLLWQGWLLRLRRRQLSVIAIIGSFAIAAYFIDYHAAGKLSLFSVFSHPTYTIGFFASYMGMPFGLGRFDALAIALGSINVLVAVLLFMHAFRKRILYSRTLIFLFSIYLFMLLSALMVTIGRMDVLEGFRGAKMSRYWVLQLMCWADLVILCVHFIAKSTLGSSRRLVIYIALLALIGYRTIELRSTLTYDDDQYANRQLAALSFENGLQDFSLTRRIFTEPSFVFQFLPFLRTHGLSVYGSSLFASLGKPAETVGKPTKEPHAGAVTSQFPVEGGLEIIGWAEADRNGSGLIVFVNEKRQIVGWGRKFPAAFPSDLRSLTTPVNEGWVGFVNLSYGARSVSPFFSTHGRLEPIGNAIAVDSDLQRVRQDMGTLLTDIEWSTDSAWTINGITNYENPWENLPRGTAYGTWSKDDHKTGTILSSPFPTPATGCLILPLAHGPFIHGLSVEITNVDTEQPIVRIPLQNGDLGWQFWRINLNGSTAHIRIIAQDKGSRWGEWLAIAQPSACARLDLTGPS